MRKIDKVENEKFYTELILDWLNHKGAYNHHLDNCKLYSYMDYNLHLSWHKVQRIIFKKIPKEVLDNLKY